MTKKEPMATIDTAYTRITPDEAFLRDLVRDAKERTDPDGVRRAYHEASETYWDIHMVAPTPHPVDVGERTLVDLASDRRVSPEIRLQAALALIDKATG